MKKLPFETTLSFTVEVTVMSNEEIPLDRVRSRLRALKAGLKKTGFVVLHTDLVSPKRP